MCVPLVDASVAVGWLASRLEPHAPRPINHVLTSVLGDKFHPFRCDETSPEADEGSGRVGNNAGRILARGERDATTPRSRVQLSSSRPACASVSSWRRRGNTFIGAASMFPGTKRRRVGSRIRRRTTLAVGRGRHTFAIEVQMAAPVLDPRAASEAGCDLSRTGRKKGYSGPRLHDLRHCTGQWAVAGGVAEAAVRSRRRLQLDATRRPGTRAK